MQNKGIVICVAVLLTLASIFYLSFSFATRYYDSEAAKIKDPIAQQDYKDSVKYLGVYSYQNCLETQIGLGLDLKGGMNVILEISVPDVLENLADHKTDAGFTNAMKEARAQEEANGGDFVSLFINAYHKSAPGHKLAEVFATQQLQGLVSPQSSDAEVEKAIRASVQDAIDNSFNVVRTRIDKFGVVQPNIQKLEGQQGRIMVEMPGISQPERMRKMLQGSANLEFWETYNSEEIAPYLQQLDTRIANGDNGQEEKDSVAADTTVAKKEVAKAEPKKAEAKFSIKKKDDAASKVGEDAQNAAAIKAHPLLARLQLGGGLSTVGYASVRDTAAINKIIYSEVAKRVLPSDLRLLWSAKPADNLKVKNIFELHALKVTTTTGRAPLEGDVITDAKDEFDQMGSPVVSMKMNTEGARKWAQMTKANVGKAIAIVLDGVVYSAPRVNGEIDGGSSQISGNFTIEDTKDLANTLKSGRMPAPARIVQEEVVGPTLGAQSIQMGIVSFVVAFVLLMVYMVMMYNVIPGMMANLALLVNVFFTLGILTSFQAALTLPGLAGMVLSLGTAVDANVLIYERIKEELRSGKGMKQAVAAGYGNAFSAIFDSNLTSLITGVILLTVGTGPIRGFATTLIIGILISFFTAVFMTRLFYDHFMSKDKLLNLTFSSKISKNLMANVHFDFMGRNKLWLTTTGVIIVICIAFLATRGLSQSIDFTGGRNFKVQFENPVEPEQVRELISSKFGDANVSVIAIGTDKKTVRISTNYRIEDEGNNVDSEIESYLYETLKPVLTQNITLETFIDRDNHTGGSIVSSQKVGPSIADDIKTGAIYSVVLALLAIGLYILLRFRNIAYSIGSIVALSCDTIMIIGAYSLFWGILPFSLEIDQTFIGAILTAIGYSINDKVVIFDRVREFFGLYPKRNKRQLFNESLNTTLARTINTSLSTLIVLLCIFILGGDSIRSFAFAMILGVIIGTLSSLFVASPIAYAMMSKKKETAEAATVAVE